jgi:hypothetical protein
VTDVGRDPCPARATVFFSDGVWNWALLGLHTHELDAKIVHAIGGRELQSRASAFVATSDASAPSSSLFAQLRQEKREVTEEAVAMAVSRALTGHAPSASVPSSLSLLRLLNMARVRKLIAAVHLPGSDRVSTSRALRGGVDSRGAAASMWHSTPEEANALVTQRGAMYAVIADDEGLWRLACAKLWLWDSSFRYVEDDDNSSIAALLTLDPASHVAVIGALVILGDQSAPTLVAALSSLRCVMQQRGYEVQARIFAQDNSFKEWAAFCFVFSSILWRSLCLWHLIVALSKRLKSDIFSAAHVGAALAAGISVHAFLVCPDARAKFDANTMTRQAAIAQSCALVQNTLAAILKMTHPDECFKALEVRPIPPMAHIAPMRH